MRRCLVIIGVLLILALTGATPSEIQAQSCAPEVEPNNDPAHAQALAGCVDGTLTESDQDIYRFTVAPGQANQAFVMILNGVPNALTKAELLRGQGADRPRSLYTLSSTHGEEVRSDSLVLSAGDYLIGVYSARVGSYRLQLGSGEAQPAAGAKAASHQKEQAQGIAGVFGLSGSLAADADWYAWTLSAADAQQLWSLSAQAALDRSVSIALYDPAGLPLLRRDRDSTGRATAAGLRLPAGVYSVQLQGDGNPGNAYRLISTKTAPLPNSEAEPNDQPGNANRWSLDTPMSGQLYGAGDLDIFRFTIDPATANTRFDLRLRTNSRSPRRLWLRLPDGTELQSRTGLGEIVFSDLSPEPGDYLLVVTGDADPGEQYTLARILTGVREAGHESEPNDTYLTPSPLDGQGRAEGRFVGVDTDIFRLIVTGKAQYWRIQVTGNGINKVRILDAVGDVTHDVGAQTQNRLRLTDVVLLPGTHYIEVQGEDGDYRVMAIPLGPPPVGVEQEPNDNVDQANPLDFGAPRTGLLNELGDVDTYRFTLAAREHIRLSVTPPDDGRLQAKVWWSGAYFIAEHDDAGLGSPNWVLDTILQPGDYVLRLNAIESGDSPYVVALQRGDPFASLADLEPNDSVDQAVVLPPSLDITGTVGAGDNYDWYRLPMLTVDTGVRIAAPPAVAVDVFDAKGQSLTGSFQRDSATGLYTGRLQAAGAQPYALRVGGNDAYKLSVAFDAGPAPVPPPLPLPLELTFALKDATVAAFWPVGQVVSSAVTMRNTGTQALTVLLEAHTSHGKISAAARSPITIPAGDSQDVAASLTIAADLPAGRYPITWRAYTTGGSQVTAEATLAASADSSPKLPRRVWPMPDAMLGGMNAALLSLGAQVVTPDPDLAQRQAILHDGQAGLQDGFQISADRLPISLTVRLAGDAAVPVVGVLLNPQGVGPDYEKLQDFELWLSPDGRNFTKALSGSLSSTLVEQAFALRQAVSARYAQLRLLSNHVSNRGYVSLGEWKVVAAPGAAVSGTIDLAAPANGGEIVTMRPQPYSQADVAGMLKADKGAARLTLPAGTAADWVLGFQQGRAAQVDALQWVDAPDVTGVERFTDLEVFASLDSPVGPWTSLGHWKLAPGQSALTLSSPVWARYLRFVSAAPAADVRLAMPDVLRVFERPISAGYRSVIGEWGHNSGAGVYEWLNPPPAPPQSSAPTNATKDKALSIASKSAIQGTVQISQTVAWYRIDVPAGQNAVVLHLSGQPTLNVRAIFQDASGRALPVTSEPVTPAEQVITATVPGGSTAYFRIEEPPRSVIFAWDNSGSLGAYQNTIFNALTSYVAGVTPGIEVVNLLPFGGKLLLKQWGEDPTVLQQALTNYDRGDSSSNVEESLLKASQELAYREGTKAVVLLTDAESNGYPLTAKLWDALAVVRPRVFTLEIATSPVRVGDAPAEPQQMMENYAAVNGGYYDYLRTTGDLDVVFARVAAWLRRPAAYALAATTVALPPPGPGKLTVLSSITGQDATAAAALLGSTAVEIIFDASGSMTSPLGKSTRIAVAHDVLNNLVDNVLPAGVPLALRAFGNREGNYSCRTDLEVPLGPLVPAALKKAVAAIQPQYLGATPIAASLLKVPEDLKAAGPGPKLIILITDGEEDCQGDPAAAAASLRAQGFDVRLNIVGLAVTDGKVTADLTKWATAGGGRFYAAADQAALAVALNQSLRVPYRVFNDKGQIVAQGTVDGDPIVLPAGVYRVEVATNPARTLDNVSISSGRDTVVRIQGGQ